MKSELFIARHLTLSDTGHKSSPALKVAVIATALSVAIMLLAVSVVSGFRREIRNKITGFDAHISLYPNASDTDEIPIINYTPELRKFIESRPYVERADLIITAPVLLKTESSFKGLYMRGVKSDYDLSFLDSNLTGGSIFKTDHPDQILISESVANKLGINAGDSLNIYTGEDLKARRVRISGIYNTHFMAYDQYFAYAPSELVHQLTGTDSHTGSSIDIKTPDFDNVKDYNELLIKEIRKAYKDKTIAQNLVSRTIIDKGNNYFAWLDMLDVNVWVILTLMSLVAIFTLISGMLIIILEKIRFIGVMRSIGASRRQLHRIFVLLALRICLIGMLIGGFTAIALIIIQDKTHFIPLDPEAYYIDFVPVSLSPVLIGMVLAGFTIITYISLILPARFAGRIKPTETLRFEM